MIITVYTFRIIYDIYIKRTQLMLHRIRLCTTSHPRVNLSQSTAFLFVYFPLKFTQRWGAHLLDALDSNNSNVFFPRYWNGRKL